MTNSKNDLGGVSMFRKIIIFLTSLLLILNSTLTSATTIGAWNVFNPFAVRASILYDGSKGAVTSSVLITPNVTQVVKVLKSGGAGFALSYAIEQLLGAVDWVMDPANNQIKYKVLECPDESTNCSGKYLYQSYWMTTQTDFHNSRKAACKSTELLISSVTGKTWLFKGFYIDGRCMYDKIEDGKITGEVYVNIILKLNEAVEEKTIPLETIAQKVIDNAQNNNLDAQFAVLAAASNILSEAEQDAAKAKLIEDELEQNINNTCNPPAGVKFNKVTHYDRHGRDPNPNIGSHGCMAKTGSPVHWHYSVNHQLPDGRCVVQKHAFGGCGVAPL